MAKTLSRVYSNFIDRVYEDDMQSQRYYLGMVENQRHIPVEYLVRRGCIFIPNEDYIKHYLGKDAFTYGCELYHGDACQWTLFVVIPILDLARDIVGLVGWDAQNKYLEISEGQKGLPMYKVSSKLVFQREKYFLADVDLLKRQFEERVIFVTDGVFDSIALNYRDIPAIALLGSTFSREVLYFLRWYRSVFVVSDNDRAGQMLFERLKKSLPNVHRVVQRKTKDIEELLRTDGKDGPITQQLRNADVSSDLYLKV